MKPRQLFVSRLSLPFAMAIAALLATPSANAAAYNWTGATSGTWNTTTNWSGSVVPLTGDTLTILGPANVAGALIINFNADNQASTINFSNTPAVRIKRSPLVAAARRSPRLRPDW
jgi:hypothetical protein